MTKSETALRYLRKYPNKSFSAIARMVPCHPSSVIRVAQEHGIAKRVNTGPRNRYKGVLQRVVEMLNEKRPRAEVLDYINREMTQ